MQNFVKNMYMPHFVLMCPNFVLYNCCQLNSSYRPTENTDDISKCKIILLKVMSSVVIILTLQFVVFLSRFIVETVSATLLSSCVDVTG